MRTRTIHRVSANMMWLVGERVFRAALALAVSGYLSRYLETVGFGAYNYALRMTTLFGAVSALGIDGVVIKELVNQPSRRDEILGTALILKLCGGLALIGLVALSGSILGSPEAPPVLMLLFSLAYIPLAFDVLDLWFQKNIQSRYTVIAKGTAYFLGSALRIGLVLLQAPLWMFCAVLFVESCFYAIGLILVFRKTGLHLRGWRFAPDLARHFLHYGWPLVFAGVLVALYQRVETFMVQETLGTATLGVYSAAQNISDMWGILPALLLPSLYPLMLQKKLEDEAEYKRRVQMVFDLVTGMGLVIAVGGALVAPFLIPLIFGPDYSGAIQILMIQSCAAPFTFAGAMRSQYFVMENLNIYHTASAIMGIAANIAVGLYLIPHLGAAGAAFGALIGFAVSSYVSSWLFPRLRSCAIYQTRALFVLFRLPSVYADLRRFL